jgi:hypothetical protein
LNAQHWVAKQVSFLEKSKERKSIIIQSPSGHLLEEHSNLKLTGSLHDGKENQSHWRRR